MDVLFRLRLYHGYALQILAAEILFTMTLRKKEDFVLRAAIGVPVYGILAVLLPNLISHYASGLFTVTIFLLSFILCVFCFRNSPKEVLFCCIGAQLTQNLAYHVEQLIYLPFAEFFQGILWGLLSAAVSAVVYTISYYIFAQRVGQGKGSRLKASYLYSFAVTSLLFVFTMQYMLQKYEIDKIWVTHPPLIICCLFGLGMQYGLLALSNEKREKMMLERFIEQEKQQHELREYNIDIINRKAHDLKHQITSLRATGRIDEEELEEIERAVEQYEVSFETGNRTLDVLLTEKHIQCQKEHIHFSAMVQGEALSFMKPGEIASLLGNALDNAIEYEQSIPDAEKRCVALDVFERKGFVCILVENYCPEKRNMEEGLPVTTKEDRDYHGFGLRSIRYIAEKYDGTLQISTDSDLFVLRVLLSVPQ